MEFNYLSEHGALRFDPQMGRYSMDATAMRTAIAALARELLEQQARGDRERIHAWFSKWRKSHPNPRLYCRAPAVETL
jgi:hypothetical protein